MQVPATFHSESVLLPAPVQMQTAVPVGVPIHIAAALRVRPPVPADADLSAGNVHMMLVHAIARDGLPPRLHAGDTDCRRWEDDVYTAALRDKASGESEEDGIAHAVVCLFGVTAAGNSAMVAVEGYRPWIRVEMPEGQGPSDAEAMRIELAEDFRLKDSTTVEVSCERLKRFYGWLPDKADPTHTRRYACAKFSFASWAAASVAARMIADRIAGKSTAAGGKPSKFARCRLTDTQVKPLSRFMNDVGLTPSDWVRCTDAAQLDTSVARHSNCQMEFVVRVAQCAPAPADAIAPLLIMSFDGEMYSHNGAFPSVLKADSTVVIGATFWQYGTPLETMKRFVLCVGDAAKPSAGADGAADDGIELACFDTSAELMEALRDITVAADPDIVTGWNTYGFDFPFMHADYEGAFLPPDLRGSEALQAYAVQTARAVRGMAPLETVPTAATLLAQIRARNPRKPRELVPKLERLVGARHVKVLLKQERVLRKSSGTASLAAFETKDDDAGSTSSDEQDDDEDDSEDALGAGGLAAKEARALREALRVEILGPAAAAAASARAPTTFHTLLRDATEEQRAAFWARIAETQGPAVAAMLRAKPAPEGAPRRGLFLGRVATERAELLEKRMSSAAKGDNTYYFWGMTGRVLVDLMQVIKDDKKPDDNTLKYAALHWLGGGADVEKMDLSASDMFAAYASGDPAQRWRICDYCGRDTEIPLRLIAKLSYVPIWIEMSRVCYTSANEVVNSGQQVKVFNLIARFTWGEYALNVRDSGWPVNDYSAFDEDDGDFKKRRPDYQGATVIEPVKGFYEDCISTLDFESLYPSIIRYFNLCPSTLVLDDLRGNERPPLPPPFVPPAFVPPLAPPPTDPPLWLPDAPALRVDRMRPAARRPKHAAQRVDSGGASAAAAAADGVMSPLAFDATGSLVHVREARPGARYTCIDCGAPMVPHQGDVRAWSFHHAAGCAHGVTPEHRLACLLLQHHITRGGSVSVRQTCAHRHEHIIDLPRCTAAQCERRISSGDDGTHRILDVAAGPPDAPPVYAVEVVQSHKMEDAKCAWLAGLGFTRSTVFEVVASDVCAALSHATPPRVLLRDALWEVGACAACEAELPQRIREHERVCNQLRATHAAVVAPLLAEREAYPAELAKAHAAHDAMVARLSAQHDDQVRQATARLEEWQRGVRVVDPRISLERHDIQHNVLSGYAAGKPMYTQETRTYTFVTHIQGVLPRLLKRLLDARKAVKRLMAEAEDPLQKAVLNGRQNGIKVACNSVYGFCGVAADRGLLPCKPVAAVTTLKGRAFIEAAKDYVEGHYEGSRVIYGDTDSVMIYWRKGVEVADAARMGQDAAAAITALLRSGAIAAIGGAGALAAAFAARGGPGGPDVPAASSTGIKIRSPVRDLSEACSAVSLAYEKTYQPYLLLRKKNYVGLKYTEDGKGGFKTELDMKGIDAVRRDRPKLLRETSLGVLRALMYERSVPTALAVLRDSLASIAGGDTPLEDFVLSKSLKGSYASNNLPHVRAWQRMSDRGDEGVPPIGARMPYVVVVDSSGGGGKKSATKLYDRTEHPGYVKAASLAVDRQYYVETLQNPLVKLLQFVAPDATLKQIFRDAVERAAIRASGIGSLRDFAGEARTAVIVRAPSAHAAAAGAGAGAKRKAAEASLPPPASLRAFLSGGGDA